MPEPIIAHVLFYLETSQVKQMMEDLAKALKY